MYELDCTRSRELAREAIWLARETPDPRTRAAVMFRACQSLLSPDTLAERAALLPEILDGATASGDGALEFWAQWLNAWVSIEQGELGKARAAFERADLLSDQLGQPTIKWTATRLAACLALFRGDLAAAEESAERALEVGKEAGEADAPMMYALVLGAVRAVQGRLVVTPMLEQTVAASPRVGAFRAGLARALASTGRRDEAAAIIRQAVANGLEDLPWNPVRLTALAQFTEAAITTGTSDAYAVLYEAFDPFADQVVTTAAVGYGLSRTYLGMLAAGLGRYEQADEHFRIASEFHRREHMLVWEARSEITATP